MHCPRVYETQRFNDAGGPEVWQSIAGQSENIGGTAGFDGSYIRSLKAELGPLRGNIVGLRRCGNRDTGVAPRATLQRYSFIYTNDHYNCPWSLVSLTMSLLL